MDIEKIAEFFKLERLDNWDYPNEIWLTHKCGWEKEVKFGRIGSDMAVQMDHVIDGMATHLKECKDA